jgi:hypothetical protein
MEFKLVRPRRPSVGEILLSDLRDHGLPVDKLQWLAELFTSDVGPPTDEALLDLTDRYRRLGFEGRDAVVSRWRYLLQHLAESWTKRHDLADVMLALLGPYWTATGETIAPHEARPGSLPLFTPHIAEAALSRCKLWRIDLTDALSRQTNPEEAFNLITLLEREGLLDAELIAKQAVQKLLDVPTSASLLGWYPRESPFSLPAPVSDPVYWVRNDPLRFAQVLASALREAAAGDRPRLACGFCAVFAAAHPWVHSHDLWLKDPPARMPRLQNLRESINRGPSRHEEHSLTLLRTAFAEFDTARRESAGPLDWDMGRAWMACYWMRCAGDCKEWEEDIRPIAAELALEQIGRLRQSLKKHFQPNPAPMPARWVEQLRLCVAVAGEQGRWWDLLERLLLLFRHVGTPTVLSNLVYWREHSPRRADQTSITSPDALPVPWNIVPRLIARTIHQAATALSESGLQELRERFAEFCIDRLSSGKDRGKPRETSEYWRAAYIGALGEMRVNPRGKGHQTLHAMVLERIEEDADVKAIAKPVYDDIRRSKALPDNVSERFALFAAFLWLRQAHYITTAHSQPTGELNVNLVKEVRRTTEPALDLDVE